jgi:hypothetical protein
VQSLLVAPYETTDGTAESAVSYALCYRCHERSQILNSVTFPQHMSHVVADRSPCSVCHDAHGISSAQATPMSNSKLINFDTSVVTPIRSPADLSISLWAPAPDLLSELPRRAAFAAVVSQRRAILQPTPTPTPTVPQPALPQHIRGRRGGR